MSEDHEPSMGNPVFEIFKRRSKNELNHLSHRWSDRRLYRQQNHEHKFATGTPDGYCRRCCGAFLAGACISPLLGVGSINDAITLPTVLVSLLGAVALLAIYKAVVRRA